MAIDFTEKLGPLPVWGWGLLGGGVFAIGYFVLNRGGKSDGGGASSSYTLDENGYQTAGIRGGSASVEASPSFDNNTLWLTRASRQVADSLSKSPSTVYSALKKWLQGEAITTEEKGIVDTALGQYGTPPEGTQGLSDVTPDAPAIKGWGRYADSDETFAIMADGTYKFLSSPAEYTAAGSPQLVPYSRTLSKIVSYTRNASGVLIGRDEMGRDTYIDSYRESVIKGAGNTVPV